jgi:hypothetical protein
MKKRTKLTLILLLGVILSGFSGSVIFGFADVPPAGATVEVLDWTYFKDPGHSVDAYFNLKLSWIDGGETKVDWVPAFCLDSGIYWSATPDRVVVASDDPGLPPYIADENLKVINYIMYLWHQNTWSGAGWEEIQHAIWHYSDMSDPTGGGAEPSYDSGVLNTIISYVDGIVDEWDGPYTVYVLDPGDGEDQNNVQLTFFEIPEVPLGTITSLIAMAGGFLRKKKHA